MRGRIRNIEGHVGEALVDWELCAAPPGAIADPTQLASANVAWTKASVPSTAAAALRAAGVFTLDAAPRNFDAEDFFYRTRFRCAPAAADERIVLAFDGLATVADVWLDGARLFSSESMFAAHAHDVTALVRDEHELVVHFRALAPLLGAKRPRPRWRVPMIENQQLRWFRTTLLGRTPGWSPPAAAVGPWRPVRVERRRAVHVADVVLHAHVAGGAGVVDVACRVEALGADPVSAVELVVEHEGHAQRVALHASGDRWTGRLEIPGAALWWPHTHGAPALHAAHLHVALGTKRAAVDLGAIGFRTIELDRSDDGFALVVNGVRVFCRGACWTPLDVLALHAPDEVTHAAVAQARAAGMNMLRVGGTMVYESDAFFDACDREGVLVWQDFMFANMDYPEGDAAFEARVVSEARQELARFQGRPCVAVLCGNSEGEQQAAMWGAPRELWSPPLFHATLPAVARALCPGVPYWPSSAHGGSFPHQPTAGTTSYYGVGAYLRPLEDARRSEVRFASECLAFANVPEPSGVAAMPGGPSSRVHHASWKARTPRDLGAGWDFDDVRDHYLAALFGVDPLTLRYADHDRYLALSRVVTGEVMAATFSEWRRRRSKTAGALVWFLRDLWPGAGWGLVDAHGTPKAPYFALRRALAPIAVSLSDEGQSGLFVHVVNDSAAPLAGDLELALHRHGEVRVGGGTRDVRVAAHEAVEFPAGVFFDGFYDTSYAYRFGPPPFDVASLVLRAPGGAILATAVALPLGFARPREADLGLVAEAKMDGEGAAELVVRARRFAQSVFVDVDGFAPSDNHFHVLPGGEHRLTLVRTTAKGALRGAVHALNAEAPTKIALAPLGGAS